jgi:hypothetical protein
MGGDVFVHFSGRPDFVVGMDIPVDLDIGQGVAAA